MYDMIGKIIKISILLYVLQKINMSQNFNFGARGEGHFFVNTSVVITAVSFLFNTKFERVY